ncbi:MAG: purine/pyrimidine permease [Rhodospirillaceae bacterium]|nr:purine/pyrimidine permease [Rhodospirillaceae bacterium]
MSTEDSDRYTNTDVRYEADEKPPPPLAFGLGLQLAILCVGGIVFTPFIVVRAAGGTEDYLSWAVFAALVICGATTMLQAIRIGRFGAGYVLIMGTSGAFIAVCIAALAKGGPGMLATLVLASSLFQFVLSERLSLFRRVLTPTVAGTVIMLIAVTVMPIVFGMLDDVPKGSPPPAAALSAFVTVAVIVGIALKATGVLRLWAPVVGVVAGSLIGGWFGIYDTARVAEAAWIGFPKGAWPGLDLSFGPVFWALLPGFVFVTLIGAIETVGDGAAIQRVSWRRSRAVDFKAVQGAVAADGVGNLLSGLLATVPNTTYSTSVSVTELTGVGARSVGIAAGAVFLALAFLPKLVAVVLAIPAPVAAAYITVLLAMLFIVGMRMVVQDGIDYRKGLVAGVAFWAGVGFQNEVIFPDYFAGFAGGLLNNGMTAGGLVAMIMTLFVELTEPRRSRIEAAFDISALPKIREFLGEFASASGWDEAMAHRLDAAGEETLLTLLRPDEADEDRERRRLLVVARNEDGGAVLEFVAAGGEENLQDKIALLGEQTAGAPIEREVSLRLLRHLASSVRHQQYHDTDIVTVRVEVPGTGRGAGS